MARKQLLLTVSSSPTHGSRPNNHTHREREREGRFPSEDNGEGRHTSLFPRCFPPWRNSVVEQKITEQDISVPGPFPSRRLGPLPHPLPAQAEAPPPILPLLLHSTTVPTPFFSSFLSRSGTLVCGVCVCGETRSCVLREKDAQTRGCTWASCRHQAVWQEVCGCGCGSCLTVAWDGKGVKTVHVPHAWSFMSLCCCEESDRRAHTLTLWLTSLFPVRGWMGCSLTGRRPGEPGSVLAAVTLQDVPRWMEETQAAPHRDAGW